MFASRSWRDTAESLSDATGLAISVVDIGTGATLSSTDGVEVCSTAHPGAMGVSLGCLISASDELTPSLARSVKATCEAGMPCLVVPVRHADRVACHVIVTGYVSSERERKRVLQRVLAAGVPEDRAREVLSGVPTLERSTVEAAAFVAVGHAELLLRSVEAPARRGRNAELAVLSDAVGELSEGSMAYGRIPSRALASVQRLAGADGGRMLLRSHETGVLEVEAETGSFFEMDSTPEWWRGIVSDVVTDGRSAVVVGPDAGEDGGRPAVLAVPVRRGDECVGALMLSTHGETGVSADEIRLVELFADIVSAMLESAAEFREINTRLVELVQVDQVAQALTATLDYDRLADLAVQILDKTLDFDAGGFVIDGYGTERGRVLHSIDLSGGDIAALISEATGYECEWPVSESVSVVSQTCELAPETGLTVEDWTVLSRELMFHDVRVGTVFVASGVQGRFRNRDERILASLTDHFSIALENALLYARLSTEFDRTMAVFAALADANERYSEGHTDRVMDHAVSIGEEMGLSLERVNLLRFAGLLHDLGKIGVAEDILVKPSTLSAEEMEHVRHHSALGASIVEQIEVLDSLTPIIRHHHEHFDGNGYPDGLSGTAIPIESRILAVADAFEAMTSERAHQARIPAATARAELEAGAGTQFDPEVVASFCRILDVREVSAATGAYASRMGGGPRPDLPA